MVSSLRFSISETEYNRRIETVRKTLSKRKINALYVTNGASMFYLTGYSFISTERPAALIVPLDGPITFIGPLLEKDHVSLETDLITDVKTYVDYPGEKHPIDHFVQFLTDMGLAKKRIGIDSSSGVAGMWGYQGEPLVKRLRDARFTDLSSLVPGMRVVKSQEEIGLMRESAKWANLATSLMQEYAQEGSWDVDVAAAALHQTAIAMKKTLGPEYIPKRNLVPVLATFRGQVGEMSAIPHSMAISRVIKHGDGIIAETGADVGGYTCELERTMIVGAPSPKQKRHFEIMTKAQKAVFKAIRPGAKCSEVDRAALGEFKKAGLTQLVRHHAGHGLGLDVHEPPWLDIGNQELLRPGMIVSCEPGIYEVGFGGFRHSDTVLVTEDGAEIVTYYPRNIEQLTIA